MIRRGQQVRDLRSRSVRLAGITASDVLIRETRIDTGKLKSNHQVGLGSPVNVVRESFFPGRFGSTILKVTNRASELNARIIGTFDADRFSALYITNSVEYGQFVFDGTEPRLAAVRAVANLQNIEIFPAVRRGRQRR